MNDFMRIKGHFKYNAINSLKRCNMNANVVQDSKNISSLESRTKIEIHKISFHLNFEINLQKIFIRLYDYLYDMIYR